MQGSVRRRRAGILIVGAAEPEVGSWLHAAGHATRAVEDAAAALAALGEEPADLVIVDRDAAGTEPAEACIALRDDVRLGSAWLLAITGSSRVADGRRRARLRRRRLPAPPVHPRAAARPRPRRAARRAAARRRRAPALAHGDGPGRDLPLGLARGAPARADHRRDRADLGVPGRQLHRERAPHADQHRPPRRPRPRHGRRRHRHRPRAPVRPGVPDRAGRRRGALGARPRPARPGRRRAAVDGRRDLRHHRAPDGRGGAAPARDRGRAHRGAARVARAHRRRGRRGAPQDRARPARRRAAAARGDGARRAHDARAGGARARRASARSSTGSGTSWPRRPPSCASWPAASTRRC